MLKFKMLPDGGFVAGDLSTGLTCYAYPTSPHAVAAKRHPALVAENMLDFEAYRKGATSDTYRNYDERNWVKLRD